MKVFCKHEWIEIGGTRQLYSNGSSKEAMFKCIKCSKERWFDIFDLPKNKHWLNKRMIDQVCNSLNAQISLLRLRYARTKDKSILTQYEIMEQAQILIRVLAEKHPELQVKPTMGLRSQNGILEGDDHNLVGLMDWLKGEKYLIDEQSTTMSEEFEREHRYELSRNIMINKTIKKIKEMVGVREDLL